MKYTRFFCYNTEGPDVKAFQDNLLELGYPLPNWGADGIYGPETEEAAKNCCRDYHWDYCSWGRQKGKPPCPPWLQTRTQDLHDHSKGSYRSILRDVRETHLSKSSLWVPDGRGMFIQSMNTVKGPEEVKSVVKRVGLKFVIIQAHWQYPAQSSNTYNWPGIFGLNQSYGCTSQAQESIEEFLDLGVTVLPFSYPVPGKEQEVLDILGKFAEAWNSPSVVIDPEVEWKGNPQEAEVLARLMSETFPSWGMSSYGAPWYHQDFPFKAFSTATYGLPQTYGVTTFGTEKDYKKAWDEWRGFGFSYMVGLYGTYDKSDAQMRQILTACAAQQPQATAGWKWGTTSDPEWEHIATILPA